MIYGANGYTGKLTAREAVSRGLKPVLAGRSEEAVAAEASQLGLEYRVFALDDARATRKALRGLRLVLHCAGPFSETSAPMVEACLAEGVHYLDITGEIAVFKAVHDRDAEARRADLVLLPGAGFDIVPTDCLAARLVHELPAATSLKLAFEAGGGPSPGTAKTSVEGLAQGGCVRRDGMLTRVPLAWKTMTVPFQTGQRKAVTIPWGDVYTAHLSTGVGNIEVYLAVPPKAIGRLKRMRYVQPLLGLAPVQAFLKKRVEASVRGPSDDRRAGTDVQLWGRAESADGRSVSATMSTPNGYDLTVSASLALVGHLLQNSVEGGYYTPSLLMGADFAESLPGVTLTLSA
ncbi:MAG: NAD(P)H-binding protein [Xanthomonadales bacterium]|nr:NAD(P)H-binding protein [Xanthomonadales bacterium]NNL05023.1 NAD(P)H-binding protein [Xanthomonadales bacterium]